MLLVLSVAPPPVAGLSKGEKTEIGAQARKATAHQSQSLLRKTGERYAIDLAADSNHRARCTGNGAVPRLR